MTEYDDSVLRVGATGEFVKVLQELLLLPPTGVFDQSLEILVKEFQVKNSLVSDGVVGKNTWSSLLRKASIRKMESVISCNLVPTQKVREQNVITRVWNSYGGLIRILANILSVESQSLLAVMMVESAGKPFGRDGRPIVRFENHIFWNQWGKTHKSKFEIHFMFGRNADGTARSDAKRWMGHFFRKDMSSPWRQLHVDSSQVTQDLEWEVLEFAMSLAGDQAINSTSFGLSQIIGFNSTQAGYSSPKEFMSCMNSEKMQIVAMAEFIKNDRRLLEAIRTLDFVAFAKVYNGPGQPVIYGNRMKDIFEGAVKAGI